MTSQMRLRPVIVVATRLLLVLSLPSVAPIPNPPTPLAPCDHHMCVYVGTAARQIAGSARARGLDLLLAHRVRRTAEHLVYLLHPFTHSRSLPRSHISPTPIPERTPTLHPVSHSTPSVFYCSIGSSPQHRSSSHRILSYPIARPSPLLYHYLRSSDLCPVHLPVHLPDPPHLRHFLPFPPSPFSPFSMP